MSVLTWLAGLLKAFADNKDAYEAIKDLAEMFAIIVGGFWTYLLFVKKREKYPRAKLGQIIVSWPLANSKIMLRTTVHVENTSEVLLQLSSGYTWIQQLKPLTPDFLKRIGDGTDIVKKDDTETRWHLLGERNYFKRSIMEIEPGEADELNAEFVIDSSVEQVLIYTYLENATKCPRSSLRKKREIGWSVSTIYDCIKQSPLKT
jgi:hypothetical protein